MVSLHYNALKKTLLFFAGQHNFIAMLEFQMNVKILEINFFFLLLLLMPCLDRLSMDGNVKIKQQQKETNTAYLMRI